MTGRGHGHTHYDTVDKVKAVHLREAATLAARIALRVASEEIWPVSCRDQNAVDELMDQPDQRAARELYERLEFDLRSSPNHRDQVIISITNGEVCTITK